MTGKSYASMGSFSNDNEEKLIYRTLGKTGIKLPIVSMGAASINNQAVIKLAFDKGIKLMATAGAYQEGNSERLIGASVKGLQRDSFVIVTNSFDINWIDTPTGVFNSAFNKREFLKRVDASLKRLGVDYVDIFIQPFAAGRESVFNTHAVDALETLKKEGLTRYTGIATHRNEPEAIRAAVDIGIHDVIMTSYNFMKTNLESLEDAIEYADEAGLGIIAMKTMAGAFRDKERTQPVNTRAALKWVLQNEHIHTTVPDCVNNDQLLQNIEVMADLKLTEEEERDLLPPSEELLSGMYCQQCGECLPQCPMKIDIPTIMRSYMYAYGYMNLPYAKQTLLSTGLKSNPCTGCKTCDIKCRMKFDIREKICDISRIIDVPQDFLNA